MPPLPVLSGGELVRALEKAGFELLRQRGSHARLKHSDGRAVTVPMHAGQDVGRGLLGKILRDAEISPEALADLLQR